MSINKNKQIGFTLVELLVVISIIGILLALSLIAIQGVRKSSRDAKRKSDLEAIRSALELYRADCKRYHITSGLIQLTSDYSFICSDNGITYMETVPLDPVPSRHYVYGSDGTTYALCASLEGGDQGADVAGCSNCGEACNYKIVNP